MTPTDAQKNREIAKWCGDENGWVIYGKSYSESLDRLFAAGGPIEKLEREKGVSFVQGLINDAYLNSVTKGEPSFATTLRDAVYEVIKKEQADANIR